MKESYNKGTKEKIIDFTSHLILLISFILNTFYDFIFKVRNHKSEKIQSKIK
jgi:hypothetical protein